MLVQIMQIVTGMLVFRITKPVLCVYVCIVPQYEVVRVRRSTRMATHPDTHNLRFSAFGQDLDLALTRTEGLFKDNLRFWAADSNSSGHVLYSLLPQVSVSSVWLLSARISKLFILYHLRAHIRVRSQVGLHFKNFSCSNMSGKMVHALDISRVKLETLDERSRNGQDCEVSYDVKRAVVPSGLALDNGHALPVST